MKFGSEMNMEPCLIVGCIVGKHSNETTVAIWQNENNVEGRNCTVTRVVIETIGVARFLAISVQIVRSDEKNVPMFNHNTWLFMNHSYKYISILSRIIAKLFEKIKKDKTNCINDLRYFGIFIFKFKNQKLLKTTQKLQFNKFKYSTDFYWQFL